MFLHVILSFETSLTKTAFELGIWVVRFDRIFRWFLFGVLSWRSFRQYNFINGRFDLLLWLFGRRLFFRRRFRHFSAFWNGFKSFHFFGCSRQSRRRRLFWFQNLNLTASRLLQRSVATSHISALLAYHSNEKWTHAIREATAVVVEHTHNYNTRAILDFSFTLVLKFFCFFSILLRPCSPNVLREARPIRNRGSKKGHTVLRLSWTFFKADF